MDVAIYLARHLRESRVLIGGVDVTAACTGVAVRASLGEPTTVTLTLASAIELTGDVERVVTHPAKDARAPE